MSTLKTVYGSAVDNLKKARIASPQLEARVLIRHVFDLQEEELVTKEDQEIPYFKIRKLKRLIAKRKKGCPNAYLTQKKEFFGREFLVNQDVLIPRPETEELVEWVVHGSRNRQFLKILDLCTGSGCIGITCILELPRSIEEVCLSDISHKAIKISKKNVFCLLEDNGKDISFITSDLFRSKKFYSKKFDLIISNPPYILKDEINDLHSEVLEHEPMHALIISNEDFYDRLLKGSFKHLRYGGWLYLENNPRLIEELALKMQTIGFKKIEIKKDLSHKKRFIRGAIL